MSKKWKGKREEMHVLNLEWPCHRIGLECRKKRCFIDRSCSYFAVVPMGTPPVNNKKMKYSNQFPGI